MTMVRTASSLVAIALMASAGFSDRAVAQVGAFGGYYSSGMDQFNYVLGNIHMQSIMRNAEKRAGKAKPGGSKQAAAPAGKPVAKPVSTIVKRGGGPVAPQKLASHYPAQHRQQAVQTFGRLLDGYRQVETRLNIPQGDMAGAMAALIVGSWSVCRNRPIVDAHFVEVASQLRDAIGQDPRFGEVAVADRQMAYEQFAILGTELALIPMALKQRPDPAMQQRACDAGREYLQQFGLDPARLDITAEGLVETG